MGGRKEIERSLTCQGWPHLNGSCYCCCYSRMGLDCCCWGTDNSMGFPGAVPVAPFAALTLGGTAVSPMEKHPGRGIIPHLSSQDTLLDMVLCPGSACYGKDSWGCGAYWHPFQICVQGFPCPSYTTDVKIKEPKSQWKCLKRLWHFNKWVLSYHNLNVKFLKKACVYSNAYVASALKN